VKAMSYLKAVARWAGRTPEVNYGMASHQTPQDQPIPGTKQVPNSAGGYAWTVDDWTRLQRFLILGSEGGSYYATERALTAENANAVLRCIAEDGLRVVQTLSDISVSGRAPKTDPTLFVLALAAARGDEATRKAALEALPRIARTGTHLMHFAAFIDAQRGWGRGLRRAVASWYNDKPARDIAYQALKYQQRDGWSHRDLLRLSHPQPVTDSHRTLYHWITQGWNGVGDTPHPDEALQQIWALERAKLASNSDEVIGLIRDYRLPREAIPTQFLNEPKVWAALLEEMPMTALIRNLATMTRVGLLTPLSVATRMVNHRLSDEVKLHKARIHPITVLSALKTYAQGHGERGNNTWKPVASITDALDRAFYLSFGNVQPTGKRWTLALDVSGSMGMGFIAGVPGLTPRVASVAMSLITAATEAQHNIVGFTSGSGNAATWSSLHDNTLLTPLSVSPRQRLDDALKAVNNLPFGGTDCALPMLWALKNKIETDVFVIYTDSETWFGKVHPAQALRQYREAMGINAQLIVVGMVANGFTIADPNDAGMLDVVGFDTATPQLISDFARGVV
jgi:60 kDa SS-A/Ro ribonucleoprotein